MSKHKLEGSTLQALMSLENTVNAELRRALVKQGEDVEIAFNHTFLTDGLLSAPEGDVVFQIVSPLKPGVIKTVGDEGFLYLLMPVRLG